MGVTENDDSVRPTGVEEELVPDPLGEEQGSGSIGARRGPSLGPSVEVDAWAWAAATDCCAKTAERRSADAVRVLFAECRRG